MRLKESGGGGGGVVAVCHPLSVMSVDDIVNAFREKNQMAWTGPKRSRESYIGGGGSDTEAEDEDQEREFLLLQENERAVIRRAQEAHYTLSSAIQNCRLQKDSLRSDLQAYSCETATNSHATLLAMAEHVYTSSASSNGQWALLLKHFAFTRSYDQLIDSGVTTVPLYVSDGHETEAEDWRLRYNDRMERALSGLLMDGAKTGLMKLGFLKEPPMQLYPSQPMSFTQTQDYDMESDTDESGGEEGAQADGGEEEEEEEGQEEEGQDEQFPVLATHQQLFDAVLTTLPDRAVAAQQQLLNEDHSMFSHAYDYTIKHDSEGGAVQLPELRSYFYRRADTEPGADSHTSPANRNGDLAAALRSLILMAVVVADDAQGDEGCRIHEQLMMDPVRDGRYHVTVTALTDLHRLILELEDVSASTDIFERLSAFETFQGTARALNERVSNQDLITPTRSPLVDLLISVHTFVLTCLDARHASGLKAAGDTSVTSYPSPIFTLDTDDYGGDAVADDGDGGEDGGEEDGGDAASESSESEASEILEIVPYVDTPQDVTTPDTAAAEDTEEDADSQATIED